MATTAEGEAAAKPKAGVGRWMSVLNEDAVPIQNLCGKVGRNAAGRLVI